MEKTTKSVGVTYGTYLGIALILITVLAYAFDLSLFTKWWFGVLSLVILLTITVIAVKNAKSQQTKYFSFKDAFTTYFVTVLLGSAIATAFSILLFAVIDPEAADVVKELTIEATRGMMANFGAPEESINEALAEMENTNQFSVLNQLKRFVYSLGFYLVLGLIVALIFREKDPSKA